jgi:hypothetical protein
MMAEVGLIVTVNDGDAVLAKNVAIQPDACMGADQFISVLAAPVALTMWYK